VNTIGDYNELSKEVRKLKVNERELDFYIHRSAEQGKII